MSTIAILEGLPNFGAVDVLPKNTIASRGIVGKPLSPANYQTQTLTADVVATPPGISGGRIPWKYVIGAGLLLAVVKLRSKGPSRGGYSRRRSRHSW